MGPNLFPLAEYWWIYASFTGLVLVMLAVDLGIFHRKAHAVSFREAATWSVVWVLLALSFSYLLYQYSLWKFPQDARLMALPGFDPGAAARLVSLEFLTGYIIEKSLSVDNIFVFVLIFGYFRIPAKYQHRVLFYGIIGALIFRAIFIALGAVLMQYHWVIFLFGAFLIFTGVNMMFSPEREIEPEKNLLIRAFKRFVPAAHHAAFRRGDGHRLCGRFRARDICRHERAHARFHIEHLCDSWAARDVLHARRGGGQIPHAEVRPRRGAGIRGAEDGLAE